MILIGISGESGSGKTLTSEIIGKSLSCEVYHLDDLQKEVEIWKRKSFLKKFIVVSTDTAGESRVVVNPKLKGKYINKGQRYCGGKIFLMERQSIVEKIFVKYISDMG